MTKIARKDAEMKAKGFEHRATAIVHPYKGAPYPVHWYFYTAPIEEEMKGLLRDKRSMVLTDYFITSL
jgi:hypothetical protein